MLFLNRVYFYSNYIKKVLISSVLVFLFSYSVAQAGKPNAVVTAEKAVVVAKKQLSNLIDKAKKAHADYKKAFAARAKAAKVYLALYPPIDDAQYEILRKLKVVEDNKFTLLEETKMAIEEAKIVLEEAQKALALAKVSIK